MHHCWPWNCFLASVQLNILSVAYPLTEVGPDAVGGSEQILTAIDQALVEAGHRSIVIAAEGSRISGTLIPSPRAGERLDDDARDWGSRMHQRLLSKTLANESVDLIHMHSLDFHRYVPECEVPILATLHLPPDWYPSHIFRARQRFQMNCVSNSQMNACPRSSALLPVVPNGVNVESLFLDAPRQDYAVVMGRICPEKGYHFALEAAELAGIPLKVAGEVFPYDLHRRYFREEIEPRLQGSRKFIGPVTFSDKRKLLASAACLVVPSVVAETSSLVAMEALACGTPVVAFRIGALPEIIDDGQTGFLVSNVQEMAEALRRVRHLNRETCRQQARTRFSVTRMTSNYLRLYEQLIVDSRLQEAAS